MSGSAAAGSTPGTFDASLRIEQADALLRQTDQYAQWQRIRQSNETQAQQLAELVIQRDALLNHHTKGPSINWQALNQLTDQLRQAGINLPLPPDQRPALVAAPTKAPRKTSAKTSQALPSDTMLREENQLILTLKCPAAGIDQTVFAYGDGAAIQLPLGEVARALDFNIQIDPQTGQASGWFLSENRTFQLGRHQAHHRRQRHLFSLG